MTHRSLPILVIALAVALAIVPAPAESEAGGDLSPVEQLGMLMYQDLDLSFHGTQSCKTCHHPSARFADPTNFRDPFNTVVSTGADGETTGVRNAPSTAYAGFSPPLQRDPATGEYTGGLFWDGRATGHSATLADPLAEQAQGPPLNPDEMAMPDVATIADELRDAPYRARILDIFGADALDDDVVAFDHFARAVAAFERSPRILRFRSRFDTLLRRQAAGVGGVELLSPQERFGLAVFTGEGDCASCHSMDTSIAGAPLFTGFGYANLGIPHNPLLPDDLVDLGLGGFLALDAASPDPIFGDEDHALQDGKFRVPSLRNVAVTPPYGHNGYFPTLRSMIEFHNTRDVGDWDVPEVPDNVTDRIGDLGLEEHEIDALIAFLHALTD